MFEQLKVHASKLKDETFVIYLAAKDTRTPWYAKMVVFLTIAYALSPIDLIPDFIPILGYLDDLIIVPGGIALAIWLIPAGVLDDAREAVATQSLERSVGYVGAGMIILIWILVVIGCVSIILQWMGNIKLVY